MQEREKREYADVLFPLLPFLINTIQHCLKCPVVFQRFIGIFRSDLFSPPLADGSVVLTAELPELPHDPGTIRIQDLKSFLFQLAGHAEKSFGNGSRHAGNGIAVAADGNRLADRVLIALALIEGNDRLRYGTLAAHVKFIPGADLVQGAEHALSVIFRGINEDLFFGRPCPGQKNTCGDRLCSFDPLRMIMRDFRCKPGSMKGVLQRLIEPPHGRHPHSAPVSETVIGTGIFFKQPIEKSSAISGVGIAAPQLLHGPDKLSPDLIIALSPGIHQCPRDCQRHHRIICRVGPLGKKRKIHPFNVIELIYRTYDISKNCSQHFLYLLIQIPNTFYLFLR